MIDFESSNLPKTEEPSDNRYYWLEGFLVTRPLKTFGALSSSTQIIKSERIDTTLYKREANRNLRIGKCIPYMGRSCFLCSHTDEAFAATQQKKAVMWCLTCGRSFYRGYDITDYTQWNPPKDVPKEKLDSLYDDAESVLLAAGLDHVLGKVKNITSNDIDVSDVESKIKNFEQYFEDTSEIFYDPKTKRLSWDNPKIKELEQTRIHPSTYAAVFIILVLCGVSLFLI